MAKDTLGLPNRKRPYTENLECLGSAHLSCPRWPGL